ncbi:hypothetical protein DPM19_14285 [Actinomadura craniellae]|uniref:DUF1232 domain-containing protein n=1 Tax=Actinomadura craniellae TaxID=2231787 RepID=A0A365H9C3_9ACTN|nr:YkvA family protein [Actinomadura craniellae]RAY14873.1 hypothetical protein DPM19_14285 [Actinomadura craniellae]
MMKPRQAAAAGHAWQIYDETRRPGAPGFGARVRALPRMLRAAARGQYKGLGTAKLGLLVFGLIYLVSPIDAVPEFIPFVGVADDLGVALWMFGALVSAAGEFVQWERNRVVPGQVIDADQAAG